MRNLLVNQRVTSDDTQPQVDNTGGSNRLTQKAYLNTVVSVSEYGVQIAVGLIINPLVVTGLGSVLFGVLQILRRWTDYLSAADGRPTQALKWAIANQQYSDNYAAKRRVIGTALGVWLLFLPILLVVGSILIWLAPLVTKAPAGLISQVRIASALLVMDLFVFGVVNLPESVLQGMNLGYKRMGIRLSMIVARGVLTGAAVYFKLGLVGIAGASLVVSIVAGSIYWVTIRKYIPWFGLVKPTMAGIRQFLSFSGWFFFWTLISRIMQSSDVVILGIVATAESVTLYTLTGYAALIVTSFIGLAVSAIIPGLGGLIGEKQHERAIDVRNEVMATNWLLAMAIGACILVWNKSFVNLWVGKVYYAGFWENLLIVMITIQLVFIRTDASIIDLTLDLRRKVALGALSTLLSIGLAAVFIGLWGIVGLCLGLLIGRFILSVAYPLLVGTALEMSPRMRLVDLARPGLVLVGLFGLSSYIGLNVIASGWIEFVVFAGITFALAIFTGFVCGLTKKQKKAMFHRFSQIKLLSQDSSS